MAIDPPKSHLSQASRLHVLDVLPRFCFCFSILPFPDTTHGVVPGGLSGAAYVPVPWVVSGFDWIETCWCLRPPPSARHVRPPPSRRRPGCWSAADDTCWCAQRCEARLVLPRGEGSWGRVGDRYCFDSMSHPPGRQNRTGSTEDRVWRWAQQDEGIHHWRVRKGQSSIVASTLMSVMGQRGPCHPLP